MQYRSGTAYCAGNLSAGAATKAPASVAVSSCLVLQVPCRGEVMGVRTSPVPVHTCMRHHHLQDSSAMWSPSHPCGSSRLGGGDCIGDRPSTVVTPRSYYAGLAASDDHGLLAARDTSLRPHAAPLYCTARITAAEGMAGWPATGPAALQAGWRTVIETAPHC